ncbi:WD40 repeat domain-containing protein [Nostoc sp.]|uniref:WD40 repeat domain-containing protein n=1 Tax=Nostoc sp. TaxID=1180 RepID=UPI002FF581CB
MAFAHDEDCRREMNDAEIITTATCAAIFFNGNQSKATQSQTQIQLVHTLTGHKKVTFGVRAVVISPNGQTLISGGRDDTIKFWNLRTEKLLRSLDADSDGVT